MFINSKEIVQFQYIVPAEGNLKALELVESIFVRLRVAEDRFSEAIGKDDELDVPFTDDELKFLQNSVSILDSCGKLSFQSLSLIRKIRGI